MAMRPAAKWALIGVLVVLACIGMGFNLWLDAARTAEARSASNFKQLQLALLNYESTWRSYPPAETADPAGKPGWSWRVLMLPYVEQSVLFNEFNFQKSWDSPENKTHIQRMPAVYAAPLAPHLKAEGKTTCLAVRGPGTLLSGRVPSKPGQKGFTRSPAETIVLVDVAPEHAVIWTRPDDWEIDPQPDLSKLRNVGGGRFLAVFGDGHVDRVPLDTPLEKLREWFDRGQRVEEPAEEPARDL